jgi:hypothetical protein
MGKADLYDKLHTDHPFTAVIPDNNCWSDDLIHSLYCITTDMLCATMPFGKSVVATMYTKMPIKHSPLISCARAVQLVAHGPKPMGPVLLCVLRRS